MTRKVAVIGAGIVGVCCAGWLQRKGFSVTLIDRDGPGEGTSFGNAGSLSPSAVLPVAMPGMLKQVPGWLLDPLGPLTIRWSYLPRAAPWLWRFLRCANEAQMWHTAHAMRGLLTPMFECYEPLIRNAHAEDLVRREGCLYVYDSEETFRAGKPMQDLRRKLGAVLEDLTESDIQRLEPALSRKFRWGIYAPANGLTVNPHRLTRTLAEQVVADGGRLLRAEISDIEVGGDGAKIIRTPAGADTADVVVIAAGAWSHRLAARFGDRIPLETQRGYHVTMAKPGVKAQRMVNWVRRRVFATPMEMGLRVAGTVEIAGLEAAPNWRRAEILLGLAKEMYPDLDTSESTHWMGHRPCLPDSLPVIGPSPRAAGIFYAFGHQHVGMCGAPGTGRTIAELVNGEKPQIDIEAFRADRF
ncbi:MAG: FAD-dependent oxidoreductase [Betaproteobacteria bacterium]|nr:FAD-dependent oxidoreductase [Betaproteobacteria bacterium]